MDNGKETAVPMPPSTRKTSDALVTYGPFQVRAITRVLANGTEVPVGNWVWLAVPAAEAGAEPTLIRLGPIMRYNRGLPHMLRHVHVWLNHERHTINGWRKIYDEQRRPAALAAYQASLDAYYAEKLREEPHATAGAERRTAEEELRGLARHIDELRGRYDVVARALRELEAQHPEIDVSALEDATDPDPEMTAQLIAASQVARQREREWWRGESGRRPRFELGEVVAEYGRFRVRMRASVDDGGRRHPASNYALELASEAPGGEARPLPWTAKSGIPATQSADREATLGTIQHWLDALQEDIERGRQALDEPHDDEVGARIRAGLTEREEWHRLVEEALGEVRGGEG